MLIYKIKHGFFMLIDNFNLFFKTTVIDNSPKMRFNRTTSRFYWRIIPVFPLRDRISLIFTEIISSQFRLFVSNNCERFADSCLAESRYWWGGRKIELYADHAIVNKEERSFTTTVDKVKSLATAFFLFLPGILLKSLRWLTNFCEIGRRNQLITEYLNRKQNCAKQYGFNRVKPIIAFENNYDSQTESKFMLLPQEIKRHILSFLEQDTNRARLALTCKENYCLTAQFDELPDVIFQSLTKNLPAVIIQSIGKDTLMNLPHEALPESVQLLCQDARLHAKFLDTLLPIDVNQAQIFLCWFQSEDYPKLIENFFNWMGSHAIKIISTPKGLGLAIRLKNNMPENFLNQEQQALIITKIKGKWKVLGINTSGSMWLFLNDMRFYNNLPEVKDYLERLFKGEHCGNFSDTLNYGVQVDYNKSRASSLLQEGPRTCQDGKTPVMQLWPA
jgi:hypothetical protein